MLAVVAALCGERAPGGTDEAAVEVVMNVWIYSMVSVVIVSMLSLMGVFALILQGEKLHRITLFLVSFAVGGCSATRSCTSFRNRSNGWMPKLLRLCMC